MTNGIEGQKSPLLPGLLLATVVVAAALPLVLSAYYLHLATEIAIYAIFAMSIDLLTGFTGRTPLGHGAIFGTASYIVAYCTVQADWSPVAAASVALLGGTLSAVVFGLLAVRVSGVYFLLLTLAEGMIVFGIALRWTTVTGAENGIRGIPRPAWLAGETAFYWFVLTALVICTAAMFRFIRSPFGLTLRGIKFSESRMRTLGYNVPLHILIGFTVSGFFAAVAGTVYAYLNSFVSPTAVALSQSTAGLLMVIIGGVGTLLGSVIGAAVIKLLENFVSLYTDRWPIVLGVTFVVVMIFARDGLIGLTRRAFARAADESRARRNSAAGTAAAAAHPQLKRSTD
jgi:branched-chain amino acid transport system permease protein